MSYEGVCGGGGGSGGPLVVGVWMGVWEVD